MSVTGNEKIDSAIAELQKDNPGWSFDMAFDLRAPDGGRYFTFLPANGEAKSIVSHAQFLIDKHSLRPEPITPRLLRTVGPIYEEE